MGTPLPPEHRKPDGTLYVSGTEYEFCDAMGAAKQTGKPTVLVYRRTEEPRIGLGDRDLDEKHRQYKGVETFFAQFTNTDGSVRQSYKPYGSPSEFADKLERELRELIQVRLDALLKDTPLGHGKLGASSDVGPSNATTKPIWQGNYKPTTSVLNALRWRSYRRATIRSCFRLWSDRTFQLTNAL